MKRPSIGALRHRISLEGPVRTGDGAGGATVVWVSLGELWAEVKPLSGGEAVVAEAIGGRISHEVLVRHRGDIAPAMRFRLGARVLEILAVLDVDERRRHLRCLCREDLL